MSLAPLLLTPLTAALKIPNPSLEQKLTQSMGPVVLMQHEEPRRHDLGSSSSKQQMLWARTQKNWTSIEQPPARYSLSASSTLGTSESPVSYEEVSQARGL